MRDVFQAVRNTTVRREWLGLASAFTWFFCSMISYYEPFFTGTAPMLGFMLLLCAGLVLSSLFFDAQPKRMQPTTLVCTLAGVPCTALLPFLPVPAAIAAYWLTAVLMSPLLARRMYGVLLMTDEHHRRRRLLSAVSLTIVFQMAWALAPLPHTIKFPIAAAFGLFSLIGTGCRLPAYRMGVQPRPVLPARPLKLLRLAAVFALLVALNIFTAILHAVVLVGSLGENDLFSLAAWATVPFSFYLFAWLGDRNRERLGFSLAMAMLLVGCLTALMPENTLMMGPMLILGQIGGTITEYSFLTMPLLFLPFTKRPILVSSAGLVVHTLLGSAVSWSQDLWLPSILIAEPIGRPLVIFGAVCILLLTTLTFSFWRRHEDEVLMAALLGLRSELSTTAASAMPGACPPVSEGDAPIHAAASSLSGDGQPLSVPGEPVHAPPAGGDISSSRDSIMAECAPAVFVPVSQAPAYAFANDRSGPPVSVEIWAQPLDLLDIEHRVVSLLCEGRTREDIAEQLHLPAAQIALQLRNIRTKLENRKPLGMAAEVLACAGRLGLTNRETEVLNELMLGRSNAEIAANLHIEESTVKTHVGKVLKKAGAGNRSELFALLRG